VVTDSESQCSVCMEDFHLDDVVRSLPCQHLFHTDCINPWLHLVDMLCVKFTYLRQFVVFVVRRMQQRLTDSDCLWSVRNTHKLHV